MENFDIISIITIIIVHIIPFIFFKSTFKTLGIFSLTIFQFFWYSLGMLSITCGYHRLFNHKSYEANKFIKLIFLIFGASSMQNSAIWWSKHHRLHHRDQDKNSDPYNIKKGFWHAHILWIIEKNDDINRELKTIDIDDLKKDYLIALQEKYYVLFLIIGWLTPIIIGYKLGFKISQLILSSIVRSILVWHSTWSVNSFAHLYGDKPYNKNITPVENLLVSIITFGEGWHNYHHSYPRDYRASHSNNNIKYWNPSSAVINLLCKLGLVTKRQVSNKYNKHKKVDEKTISNIKYDIIDDK
jgi:stearoyl-CoA desaturase (delta-9 desaturase)